MAATATKSKYAYAPSRVYSYSRAALAEELPEYEPQQSPARAPRQPAKRTHPGHQTRVNREPSPAAKRKRRFMPKLMSVSAVFITAAVLIYMIVRYATITAAWTEVNALQASIVESERRITQLEVQLDEAEDLADAKDTALAAGLDYPAAEQIMEVDGADGGN
ncbi:MAG TPA: hypothetical protein VN540_06040 [Clostridia bacterium]|nr:hypothetical protein [Clostridia bacterium]